MVNRVNDLCIFDARLFSNRSKTERKKKQQHTHTTYRRRVSVQRINQIKVINHFEIATHQQA